MSTETPCSKQCTELPLSSQIYCFPVDIIVGNTFYYMLTILFIYILTVKYALMYYDLYLKSYTERHKIILSTYFIIEKFSLISSTRYNNSGTSLKKDHHGNALPPWIQIQHADNWP